MGKAKNLKNRVSSYFSNSHHHDSKTQKLINETNFVEHIIAESEIDAFLLEANLIKKYKPFYNIKMTDDKSYPYIKISKKDIPSVTVVRKTTDQKAYYFGPYPEGSGVRSVLRIIRRIFPFESVENHSKKKCLYNHLKLCPCASALPQNKTDYLKNIKQIKNFLKGKKWAIIKDLVKEQKKYVLIEEFEKASEIQKQINSMMSITSPRFDPNLYTQKPNFYYERIKSELSSLHEILQKYMPGLAKLKRIECYDVSNTQGSSPASSMVVFSNGDSDKSQYRKFKIRSLSTPDDFLMIFQTLTRRLKRTEWQKPDLIVVDGGKGQVVSAFKAMAQNNISIPLIGLAKKEETVVIGNFTKIPVEFTEVRLPKSTPAINLLRRIRDEAHRFALSYHRYLRSKASYH